MTIWIHSQGWLGEGVRAELELSNWESFEGKMLLVQRVNSGHPLNWRRYKSLGLTGDLLQAISLFILAFKAPWSGPKPQPSCPASSLTVSLRI